MNNHKGFTLIELLVTLSTIAVILSMTLAGVASARVRSRDTKRIADLQTIQSALEQHAVNDSSHSYPPDDTTADANLGNYCTGYPNRKGIYTNDCFNQYLSVTPLDPRGNQYSYVRPACLTIGNTAGNTTMIHEDNKANCAGANQRYSTAYGLHVILESDKNQDGSRDISPTDPISYDLMP